VRPVAGVSADADNGRVEILLLILLAVALAVIVLIWITASLVGLLITLVVAGVVGWLADLVVPGRLPYGPLGAVVAGLVGCWIGTLVLGDFGPELRGIALIPAFLGAVLLAVVAEFVLRRRSPDPGGTPTATDRP
jgi:uncharacterized membrane protein YeaQ/YmgE (transglycosylase-associated protein family)